MNTSKIKSYAIQARRDFLKAVTERANIYGIFADDHIEPIEFKGDMAIIGERAFTKKEGELREKLVSRVKRDGFTMVMRSCAYTWFNRFVALRYMEIHGYLEHGYRVLSNNGGSAIPEILEHAADVEFQSIEKKKIIDFKLAGTKDNELYRLLILAQCDDLHKSMPFLFDLIDNETELLLPDNLVHSDSPLRKMVTEIDESDWNDVEIIGWIYQFYISERKDEVIGKVVQSEDIPAATQLFTPNWIVKYMVQNTLGRMWLATYPGSPLKGKMEYYIEPAEQEPEVQRQLDVVTPKELNPEEITFLDPACGSGHILIEAYDIFKEIYLERGYRTKDIPKLILEKNLYGLDIDDRAAQIASFAMLVKAKSDDRYLLNQDELKLNIMAIKEGNEVDISNTELLFNNEDERLKESIKDLIKLFKNGKTFGSLITVPEEMAESIEEIETLIHEKDLGIFEFGRIQNIFSLIYQTKVLSKRYDCVVTNPPYIGHKYLNPILKNGLKNKYNNFEKDIFSAFIVSNKRLAKKNAMLGFMTPFVWMFISSFKLLRELLIKQTTLSSLVQLEYSGFTGATVPICTFVLQNNYNNNYLGFYIKLSKFKGAESQGPKTLEAIRNRSCKWAFFSKQDDYLLLPNYPIAYWISENVRSVYRNYIPVNDIVQLIPGMDTGNTKKFIRLWHEIAISKIAFNYREIDTIDLNIKYWIPYNKGGSFRKWYGNNEFVVNWKNGGKDLHRARTKFKEYYLKQGVTWTYISSTYLSARSFEHGFLWDRSGSSGFERKEGMNQLFLGVMCSKVGKYLLDIINPTLNYAVENILALPLPYKIETYSSRLLKIINELIEIAKNDWNFYETSWDFKINPLLEISCKNSSIHESFKEWCNNCQYQIQHMQELESESNCIIIEAYGLQNEFNSKIPEEQITLARADKETDIKHLISYAIGCMMGRYSFDHPGLFYAHSGNIDFDPSKYKLFPADDDGIIPIMDQDWFPDDATKKFVEFLKVAWSSKTLDENLTFVAESLNPKRNETSNETIRRYLSTTFFKDHIKTYKKCPIYWLFSSGKQKAFECLVYLHRYNEFTLSRMRSTYVTPLQSNFSSRLEFLQDEKDAAFTTSAKKKFQKEIDQLNKKQAELSKFDDELRHYADMKISLDLDDGVKVNYRKFGNLLAEKKAITGKK